MGRMGVETYLGTPNGSLACAPMDDESHHLKALTQILQNAYSGELAAAYAYRGHWKSVKKPEEREMIHQIEQEEWSHRAVVGSMLAGLGSKPRRFKEWKMWLIGRTLGALCHVSGWFFPMFFAGQLEVKNVSEYDTAAGHAKGAGREDLVPALSHMAITEKEHEIFFFGVIREHRLFPLMKKIFKISSAY